MNRLSVIALSKSVGLHCYPLATRALLNVQAARACHTQLCTTVLFCEDDSLQRGYTCTVQKISETIQADRTFACKLKLHGCCCWCCCLVRPVFAPPPKQTRYLVAYFRHLKNKLCSYLGLFASPTLPMMPQGNSSLPLRLWVDEYAFTSGETTLLREEIEVGQAHTPPQQESGPPITTSECK